MREKSVWAPLARDCCGNSRWCPLKFLRRGEGPRNTTIHRAIYWYKKLVFYVFYKKLEFRIGFTRDQSKKKIGIKSLRKFFPFFLNARWVPIRPMRRWMNIYLHRFFPSGSAHVSSKTAFRVFLKICVFCVFSNPGLRKDAGAAGVRNPTRNERANSKKHWNLDWYPVFLEREVPGMIFHARGSRFKQNRTNFSHLALCTEITFHLFSL